MHLFLRSWPRRNLLRFKLTLDLLVVCPPCSKYPTVRSKKNKERTHYEKNNMLLLCCAESRYLSKVKHHEISNTRTCKYHNRSTAFPVQQSSRPQLLHGMPQGVLHVENPSYSTKKTPQKSTPTAASIFQTTCPDKVKSVRRVRFERTDCLAKRWSRWRFCLVESPKSWAARPP